MQLHLQKKGFSFPKTGGSNLCCGVVSNGRYLGGVGHLRILEVAVGLFYPTATAQFNRFYIALPR